MSFNQPFLPGANSVKYTVEHRDNCILIFGSVPMTAFAKLVELAPQGAVLDTDAARITGSTFAFGLPDDMARMQAAAEPAALQYQQNARPGIASELAKWIALGERGDSSEALFTRLTGINVTDGASQGLARVEHPLDPSDFRRCRLMLEKCPTLLPRLQDAAGMSPQWNGLVMAWDEICRVMDDEAPGWRNPNPMRGQIATQTYDLIKQATGR